MLKLRVLTTVSAVALGTAMGVSGAKADNLTIDLSTPPGSLVVAAGSSADAISNVNINLGGSESATAQNIVIAFPNDTLAAHDVDGGLVNISVDAENEVFAEATGNEAASFIDSYLASNGGVLNDDGAVTLGSYQLNSNHSVTALADNADIQADVRDLGAGSSVTVSDNLMRAVGVGNTADNEIAGDINPLLASDEIGQSLIRADGAPALVAGATALIGNVQINDGAATYEATVSDSRIGLLAQTEDKTTEIVGVPLDVTGNSASAAFTGNAASNAVDLGDGKAVTFVGTAGVANVQANDGDFSFDAEVRNVVIEAGNTQNYSPDAYISDLNGSTLTLEDNEITATATSNSAANSVSIDGLSQDGATTARRNVVNFGADSASFGKADTSEVKGDLFIANAQYSSVGVNADVNTGAQAVGFNLLGEDAVGSTLVADGNEVSAAATGSIVDNEIAVTDATTFDSLVAINSLQYTEGSQSATIDGTLTVDVASTEATLESVTKTSISVDGNSFTADAMGNSHSSSISIDGTTVDGPGSLVINPILSDRAGTAGGVSADISILNAQVLDGGAATSDVNSAINVDVADKVFTTASLNVTDNEFAALAIGNLSTEASVDIDATTVLATVGVLNSQTVEDGALLSANINPNTDTSAPAFVDVDVAAGVDSVVKDAAIHADGNTFSSRVWGNLADSTTNSISISGVTVGDNQAFEARTFVGRGAPGGFTPYTAMDSGFALLNDQSVEDLNTSVVTASATGDLVNVTVGSNTADISDADITASKNSGTTSATLNQATNSIDVDAITLNGSSSLANVQSLLDQDAVDGSAEIAVSQTDLDITVDVIAGGDVDVDRITAAANSNALLASARINLASNTVNVTAQTQTLDTTIDSTEPSGTKSVLLTAGSSNGQGENMIVNDQAFQSLGVGGVLVSMTDNDITVNVSIDDEDLDDSVVEADFNTVTTIAAGNDASNTLTIDVGSFDLSTADDNGAGGNLPTNGPIGTIASNQYGAAGQGSGGFTSVQTDTTIAVDVNRALVDDTEDLRDSNLSVDGNSVRALARSNNVSNALIASGTSVTNGATPDPLATTAGTTLTLDNTTFAVGSRQVNSVDVTAGLLGTTISVEAGSAFGGALEDDIEDSSITANSNLVVAEARGNDAANAAALNFTDNQAQATVANLQTSDSGVRYVASTAGTFITVLTDADNTDDSSFSASGNAVGALGSANRATNTLSSAGTNVMFRNGDNMTVYDPTPAPNSLSSDASLLVLNSQTSDNVEVDVDVFGTLIGVIAAGDVNSGSLSADSNLIIAQATQHNAVNTLNINAGANIDSDPVDDRTPGAAVVSQQTLNGTDTESDVTLAGITAIADDTRSDGSVAITAEDNQIIASSIGGTAVNTLRATAGAAIDANNPSPQALGGTNNTSVSAGFAVLNVQTAVNSSSDSDVQGAAIIAGGLEDYSFDSVTIADNLVRAEARGFVASNTLVLDAGSSSNATAVLASLQLQDDARIDANVGGVAILTGNIDEGAEDSSLTVAGNTVEAIASANRAVNRMESKAGATLQESSGLSSTIDPTAASQITVAGSDYTVLNVQGTSNGTTVDASVSFVGIGIDGLEETTGVDRSALNVEGNQVLASAVGNEAINTLVLNTGTFQHPTASINNLQTNSGTTVTATVDGVAIGIGGITTLNANSDNSSLTVRGNSVGATAIGNSAVNILRSGN
jgi:hypothetical protein